jgi:hypothetical protein
VSSSDLGPRSRDFGGRDCMAAGADVCMVCVLGMKRRGVRLGMGGRAVRRVRERQRVRVRARSIVGGSVWGSRGGGSGVGCGCGIVRGAATWALASSSENLGSSGSRLCSKLGLGFGIYDMLLFTTYCSHYLNGYYPPLSLLRGIIHRSTIKHYPLGFGSRDPAMQLCTKVLQTEESNLAMHPHWFPCLSLSLTFPCRRPSLYRSRFSPSMR